MNSNEPLERLIRAVMALDAQTSSADQALEVRCLWRKIEWAASEAEAAVRRVEQAAQKPAGESGKLRAA